MSPRHRCCPHPPLTTPLRVPTVISVPSSPIFRKLQTRTLAVPAHFSPGESRLRDTPPHPPMVKIFCGTKMRHVTHISISGSRESDDKDTAVTEIRLSHSEESRAHGKKVDSSGDSQCLSSRSSINIMKLARNI